MGLNIPNDLDLFFYIQFAIFYLIGFFYMTAQDGIVTIDFIHDNKDYYLNDQVNYEILTDYENKLEKQNRNLPIIVLILYFIISPLVSYIFAFYWWRKGLLLNPKHLYRKLVFEKRR